MNECEELDILNEKIEAVMDWAREELDLSLVGMVGVLDSLKFELLCEIHGIEPEVDEEDYDALA